MALHCFGRATGYPEIRRIGVKPTMHAERTGALDRLIKSR
jgi:hypothetical protein